MVDKKRLKILFLCTGNSCRSQMAEAWARHLKKEEFEVFSAGTEPKGVDPLAVEAMSEVGIDISSNSSKHIKDLAESEFDYVITLCGHAKETCPVFPGRAKVVHHGFDDPPKLAANAADREEAISHYRRVRDEIKGFVENLPGSLEEDSKVKFVI